MRQPAGLAVGCNVMWQRAWAAHLGQRVAGAQRRRVPHQAQIGLHKAHPRRAFRHPVGAPDNDHLGATGRGGQRHSAAQPVGAANHRQLFAFEVQ